MQHLYAFRAAYARSKAHEHLPPLSPVSNCKAAEESSTASVVRSETVPKNCHAPAIALTAVAREGGGEKFVCEPGLRMIGAHRCPQVLKRCRQRVARFVGMAGADQRPAEREVGAAEIT